ncbi:hypothetical protein [Texcoconibacillus texcoconensis]|uniref:Uncharacterized protein n=1 Tax=Texcoconibacillus texcoconensis TaxID=1095777 RepID=A0A840QTL7_9BACI|nr:hypothetical protein [Texcoconibacillus texcoconensis]MBB5174862.1 hypothetical protein [Texcoconibacillus texcoconensis]
MTRKRRRVMTTPEEEIVQLKQKMIHYRSELSKYESQISQYKKLLERKEAEKQAVKRQFSQQQQTAEQNTVSPNKQDQNNDNNQQLDIVQGYFQYACFFPTPEDEDDSIHILGDFMITNYSDKTLHNPIICFRTNPTSSIQIGGKIDAHIPSSEQKVLQSNESWVYVHDDWRNRIRNDGEHWLRPRHFVEIAPGQSQRFQQFDMTISRAEDVQRYRIEGFFYCNEHPKGLPSLNTISVYT